MNKLLLYKCVTGYEGIPLKVVTYVAGDGGEDVQNFLNEGIEKNWTVSSGIPKPYIDSITPLADEGDGNFLITVALKREDEEADDKDDQLDLDYKEDKPKLN